MSILYFILFCYYFRIPRRRRPVKGGFLKSKRVEYVCSVRRIYCKTKTKRGYIRKEIPTVVNIYLAGWRRRAFRNSGRGVTEVNKTCLDGGHCVLLRFGNVGGNQNETCRACLKKFFSFIFIECYSMRFEKATAPGP